MKFSKLSLYALAVLSLLAISALPGFADKIPTKRPSSYGDQDSQVLLAAPSFAQVSQDGVTVTLDSVFCNSCSPGNPTNLEYFFDINLAADATLSSLTFGPGFDISDPLAFSVVQFDPAIPGDPCTNGSSYICHVPFTSALVDLSSVESTLACDAVTGICTLNFTNFNFATLGGGPIVFAATTPFGVLTSLNDPVTGGPLTPSVTVNGKSTVSVPEPSGLWFAGITLLVCFGMLGRRQRRLASAATC